MGVVPPVGPAGTCASIYVTFERPEMSLKQPGERFQRLFGCRYPLQQAGMGSTSGPELVSNAGALGISAYAKVVEIFYGAPEPELVQIAQASGAVAGWQVGSVVFGPSSPTRECVGNIDALAHYAGLSVDAVTARQSAAEVVEELIG